MTHDDVQGWLDATWPPGRPTTRWRSGLFAEDAEYRYHPADEPIVGRAAIVASGDPGGRERRDEPGTYAARYEPCRRGSGVAVGWSRYWTTPPGR